MQDEKAKPANDNFREPRDHHRELPEHQEIYELLDRAGSHRHPDGPDEAVLRDQARRWEVDKYGLEAVEAREALTAKWFPDGPEGARNKEFEEREGGNKVTPEQKERVDQALGKAEISAQIGGASDVSGKPTPNEPTPMEQSRNVGQDLQRQGVTMDKDK